MTHREPWRVSTKNGLDSATVTLRIRAQEGLFVVCSDPTKPLDAYHQSRNSHQWRRDPIS